MANLIFLIFILLIPFGEKTGGWLNLGGGLNLTTLLLVLLVFIWFARRKANEPLVTPNALNLPILLLMILIYFSLWVGYAKFGISPFGWEFHAYKRFITLFILFFAVANAVKDKKTMGLLLVGMAFVILIISLVTLKEYRESYRWHYDDSMRFMVAGMQPNLLGSFLAQSLPMIAAFVFINKKLKSRIFYLAVLLIGLPALMFTYSRGSYLSIMLALIVMAILGGRHVILRVVPVFLVALVAISLVFGRGRILPTSVTERFTSIKEEGASIKTRKTMWAMAEEYIKESPLIGHGYSSSRFLLPRDTHNMYIDLALESGIPAVLILIWVFIAAFKVSYSTFRRSKDPFYKAVALGATGSLVAVIIGNIFGTRLNFFPATGYFAVILGMTVRAGVEEKKALAVKKVSK